MEQRVWVRESGLGQLATGKLCQPGSKPFSNRGRMKRWAPPFGKKERQSLIKNKVIFILGWSGGAMILGKLPVPGRPANLNGMARAYCACSRCGWGCLDIFFLSSIISLFFLPLLGDGPF